MAKCWETRGCDEEWQGRCPHNLGDDLCPSDCINTNCDRATHVVATDFELLLNPDRDYDRAPKEVCRSCEFFLKYGPDVKDRKETDKLYGGARFLF